MTTLKDVAKYAHVSTGTVSNYINGTKPVSPQKVTQIENAINKLHYIPDNSAKTLKTGKSSEVGVILPTLHDQYYVDVFYGIQNFFSYTHSVNIYLTNDNPELEKVHINLLLSKK